MLISKVEVVYLVLSYLKEEKYKDSYECFLKENSQLLNGNLPIRTIVQWLDYNLFILFSRKS